MYQGKSIQELATEVDRQRESKRDFVGPTTDLLMVNRTPQPIPGTEVGEVPQIVSLNVGGDQFDIDSTAHAQIADRLNIPKKYYDRMLIESPHLLTRNVNHWFQNKSENRLTRTLDGSVRAFLSDRYRKLDNDLVMSSLIPVFGELGITSAVSCEITPRRMYIKVTLPTLRREIKRGDIVEAGLCASNSEVGQGVVSILPIINRLVCLNGMVVNEFGLRKHHLGKALGQVDSDKIAEWFTTETIQADNKAFLMKLRDSVKGILTEEVFTRITDRMIEATGVEIQGSPEKVVEVVKDKLDLTDAEGGNVLRHLIKGGDLSMWGVANAVTAEANQATDYDRATELESAGGKLIELPKESWKEILAA